MFNNTSHNHDRSVARSRSSDSSSSSISSSTATVTMTESSTTQRRTGTRGSACSGGGGGGGGGPAFLNACHVGPTYAGRTLPFTRSQEQSGGTNNSRLVFPTGLMVFGPAGRLISTYRDSNSPPSSNVRIRVLVYELRLPTQRFHSVNRVNGFNLYDYHHRFANILNEQVGSAPSLHSPSCSSSSSSYFSYSSYNTSHHHHPTFIFIPHRKSHPYPNHTLFHTHSSSPLSSTKHSSPRMQSGNLPTDKNALIAYLSSLSHDQRMQTMARLGRDRPGIVSDLEAVGGAAEVAGATVTSAETPATEVAAAVNDDAQSHLYLSLLALQAAVAAKDALYIRRSILQSSQSSQFSSSSVMLAKRAVSSGIHLCIKDMNADPRVLIHMLDTVPPYLITTISSALQGRTLKRYLATHVYDACVDHFYNTGNTHTDEPTHPSTHTSADAHKVRIALKFLPRASVQKITHVFNDPAFILPDTALPWVACAKTQPQAMLQIIAQKFRTHPGPPAHHHSSLRHIMYSAWSDLLRHDIYAFWDFYKNYADTTAAQINPHLPYHRQSKRYYGGPDLTVIRATRPIIRPKTDLFGFPYHVAKAFINHDQTLRALFMDWAIHLLQNPAVNPSRIIPNLFYNEFLTFDQRHQHALLEILKHDIYQVIDFIKFLPPNARFQSLINTIPESELPKRLLDNAGLDYAFLLAFPPHHRFHIVNMVRHEATMAYLPHNEPQFDVVNNRLSSYIDIQQNRDHLQMTRCRNSDVQKRATAYEDLIRATEYSAHSSSLSPTANIYESNPWTQTLDFLLKAKNDQDQVKCTIWFALSNIYYWNFTNQHATCLKQLYLDGIQASDSSHRLSREANSLAFSIIAWITKKGLQTSHAQLLDTAKFIFTDCIKLSNQIIIPHGAFNKIDKSHLCQIVNLILDIVDQSQPTDQIDNKYLNIVNSLQDNLIRVPRLVHFMERLLQTSSNLLNGHIVQYYLSDKDKQKYIALLQADPSAVTINQIQDFLWNKRQDLLDPYLQPSYALKGIFSRNPRPFNFPVTSKAWKLVPRQQLLLKNIYTASLEDEALHTSFRAKSILSLSYLCYVVDYSHIASYLKHDVITFREKAIVSIGWLDDPAPALPVLLDFLDVDEARVAMYTMAHLATLLPTTLILDAIQKILAKEKLKITVRKEALRMLGRIATSDALDVLYQSWLNACQATHADLKIHKDVKIAYAHAARKSFYQQSSREILKAIAQDEEQVVAFSLLSQKPKELSYQNYLLYAKLLLTLAESNDSNRRRALLQGIAHWIPGSEAVVAAVARDRLLLIDESPEWRDAVRVLLMCCADTQAQRDLVTVFSTYAAQASTNAKEMDQADPSVILRRDSAYRQRLCEMTLQIIQQPNQVRAAQRDVIDHLADICSAGYNLGRQNIQLAMSILQLDSDPAHVDDFYNDLAVLAYNEHSLIVELRSRFNQILQKSMPFLRWEACAQLASRLIQDHHISHSLSEGLLAIDLLRAATSTLGSNDIYREQHAALLIQLRKSELPSVAMEAADLWITTEL